ncbi:hypothetical protein TNCV_207211 [Trichonephila clavipes]|nr:hypothetical protein TNCV_207211 [Trichonephila clavipes]
MIKDDFKFYHGRGSTAPTVKDIRDEDDRMANHRLSTLSMQARAFYLDELRASMASELRASNNTALEHRTHCPSNSSELPVRVSAAGGSAIYRNLQSSTNCSEIIVKCQQVMRKFSLEKTIMSATYA